MEDLARLVAIILFFPLVLSPLTFLLVWKFSQRWLIFAALPISIISSIFGLMLLLSEIGVVARFFGLWGLLFALGTWRIMWRRASQSRRDGS
jgi:hypothetical protein